ncbi:MAG: sugar-binding protein [Victivallaceae bacterium]|nr:sugar-binding protein [Victivallaceae bacterium]
MLWILLFLLFVAVFSFSRSFTGECAVGLLALTHEVSVTEIPGKGDSPVAAIHIVTDKKLDAGKTAKSRTATASAGKTLEEMFKNPVTANFPKTQTPVICYREGFPYWEDAGLTLFAPLRKYDGTLWNREKTEIKASTDGRRLYVLCRFYDKNPAQAVTSNSAGNAWRDDSIELFLMKDRKSDFYCQYIVSVSGSGCVLYDKNTRQPNRGERADIPKNFVSPRYSVNSFEGGFEIEMSIALSNIGIRELKPGASLLMQIVRNYRGQGYSNSVLLQLFPVYIYGDKRLRPSNHDRRAFQPAVVQQKK